MDSRSASSDASEGVAPNTFLSSLRELVPQFNELTRGGKGPGGMMGGRGYAQQGGSFFVFIQWFDRANDDI